MPIPVTYSAPDDEAYPDLAGFDPSPEDSICYAVWLLMMADDVIRRRYSNDPNDAAAGVRIYMGPPEYDPQTLGIVGFPCMIVDVDVAATVFEYSTSHAGELKITAGIIHIEACSTEMLSTDVSKPSLTARAILSRVDRILMRGTLYDQVKETRDGKLIDPYRTPRNEDGTYDIAEVQWLNTTAPTIRSARPLKITKRFVRTVEELSGLHPVRDWGLSCARRATYTVPVRDRDTMR